MKSRNGITGISEPIPNNNTDGNTLNYQIKKTQFMSQGDQ